MSKIRWRKNWCFGLGILAIFCLSCLFSCLAQDTSSYVRKGWAASGKKDFSQVYQITDECINKFSGEADRLAVTINDFPISGEESKFAVMNDVATCYFIKGEALMKAGEDQKAIVVLEKVIEKYPFAQAYDPRGWYWSIKKVASDTIIKIKTGVVGGIKEEEEEVIITSINLHDPGIEFPVDYEKYGEFVGVGTQGYKYVINNPIELANAVGEGIYPNSTSVKFDPAYIEVKKSLGKIDHWKILNSRDLSKAFYKWTTAPEPQGVKQFYSAELLERSGLLQQAIKAYYSVVVHFPQSYGWTYWHTPWYVGKAALYRIKHLLEENPQLALFLEGAWIDIENGFDNNVRNDIVRVNPGKLVRTSLGEKLKQNFASQQGRSLGKVISRGQGDRVSLVQYESGDWQLFVDDKPFTIRGITYSPTKIGESPDEGNLQDWTRQDTNQNNIIDAPYESWVDKNKNNRQDQDESTVGDFQLLHQMGVNTIRLYHQSTQK